MIALAQWALSVPVEVVAPVPVAVVAVAQQPPLRTIYADNRPGASVPRARDCPCDKSDSAQLLMPAVCRHAHYSLWAWS